MTDDNRPEIKKRYEERKKQLKQNYSSYHRICQDYIYDLFLLFPSGRYEERPLMKGGEEKLTLFNGKIINRMKKSKKLYESKYNEYWLYKTIALQNTILDAIIEQAAKKSIDIWNCEWIKVKLKFYSNRKHSWCKIFELKETTQQELLNEITKSVTK